MSIRISGVSRRFGTFQALSGVDLQVPSGSLTALLGPSGSGKTTLLRIIAGLESADAGQVLFDDRDVTELAARERGVGFVFQHYALFRHMTVAENIAFGLRVRRAPSFEVTSRVQELLRLVRLEGLGQRLPSELSGGQRQRVALCGPWPCGLRCCCWMSRLGHWMREFGRSCVAGCGDCTRRCMSRPYLSRTTRKKRLRWLIRLW